jgi:DNA-binding NarL/FixJ family response regulator
LLAAGVHAVIRRDSTAEELSATLAAAEEGLVVLDNETAQEMARRVPHLGSEMDGVEELTERESEILELLAEGIGNKEIARRLGISEHTAKFHISSILGKLSVSNRTEAVARAIRQGLIIL